MQHSEISKDQRCSKHCLGRTEYLTEGGVFFSYFTFSSQRQISNQQGQIKISTSFYENPQELLRIGRIFHVIFILIYFFSIKRLRNTKIQIKTLFEANLGLINKHGESFRFHVYIINLEIIWQNQIEESSSFWEILSQLPGKEGIALLRTLFLNLNDHQFERRFPFQTR